MFKQYDRKTVYLFPPSVQYWSSEGHLSRLIVDIVEQYRLQAMLGVEVKHAALRCGKVSFYRNATDEESRIIPASGGGFKQEYNAHEVVDTE